LPINLATALRLADAPPVIITAVQASVEVAAAQLARARVAWLPTIYTGAGYYRHDGAAQGASGNFYINTPEQFMAGAGPVVVFAATDALFAPLAARQVLRSRVSDVEAARNDALLTVAEAYFNVQQARGHLAGTQDVVDKGRELGARLRAQGQGSFSPTDVHRARTVLAEYEDFLATAREQWRVASADLTQVLRLDPGAVVVPVEPPHLLVTLISPQEPVDDLIPVGLTNRLELASQQALVQATLARLRQERLRPLLPSLIVHGDATPVVPGGFRHRSRPTNTAGPTTVSGMTGTGMTATVIVTTGGPTTTTGIAIAIATDAEAGQPVFAPAPPSLSSLSCSGKAVAAPLPPRLRYQHLVGDPGAAAPARVRPLRSCRACAPRGPSARR
jgi:hypothetical protein